MRYHVLLFRPTPTDAGIAFIAAFVLLVVRDEERAFWVLVGLLDDVFALVFSTDGPSIENQIFCEIVRDRLPQLGTHLDAMELPIEILCTEWLMCAFTTTLPCASVLHLWDMLILGSYVDRLATDHPQPSPPAGGCDHPCEEHQVRQPGGPDQLTPPTSVPSGNMVADNDAGKPMSGLLHSGATVPSGGVDVTAHLGSKNGSQQSAFALNMMHLFGVAILHKAAPVMLAQAELSEVLQALTRVTQSLWTFSDVIDAARIEAQGGVATEGLGGDGHGGVPKQLFAWSMYVGAKRHRLTHMHDVSKSKLHRLRQLESLFQVHATSATHIRCSEFMALCLEVEHGSASQSDQHTQLSQQAKIAFEAVDTDGNECIAYEEFLRACRMIPQFGQILQLATLRGGSPLDRLASLFAQHCADGTEQDMSREQMFGFVRAIYTAWDTVIDGTGDRGSVPDLLGHPAAMGLPANTHDASAEAHPRTLTHTSTGAADGIAPSSRGVVRAPSTGKARVYKRTLSDNTANRTPGVGRPGAVDLDITVAALRRLRVVADRLFDLVDVDGVGRITFEEFVRHGQHTSTFLLALNLLNFSGIGVGTTEPPELLASAEHLASGSITDLSALNLLFSLPRQSREHGREVTVGNPFFCFNVDAKDFSTTILHGRPSAGSKEKTRKRIFGDSRKHATAIEFVIAVTTEFSEEISVARTHPQFYALYTALIGMTQNDTVLPVHDVAVLSTVSFPKAALRPNATHSAIAEQCRQLQQFLDSLHMMNSPMIHDELLQFLLPSAPNDDSRRISGSFSDRVAATS